MIHLYYLSITVREIFLNNGTREFVSVTPNTGKAELGGKQILLDIPWMTLLFVVAIVTVDQLSMRD